MIRSEATPEGIESAASVMHAALVAVCETLAKYRDGELPGNVSMEELKYLVVDRALECAEPGFDGGTTSANEAMASIAGFRAMLR